MTRSASSHISWARSSKPSCKASERSKPQALRQGSVNLSGLIRWLCRVKAPLPGVLELCLCLLRPYHIHIQQVCICSAQGSLVIVAFVCSAWNSISKLGSTPRSTHCRVPSVFVP
ncbi:hypothetical protein M440DRAFT_178373 [Trichoderma longibrachiatum ATCC 18648]|uniref:Uncharacterized protein n=1 Tax=Trichoderma longibrachiatum ATCC 18648 TaxID=983965 RepID=A0A2T4CEQ0_TRILO|nr:hypothetical protein M440DRAFT_178373 [Trichoderma longibrachiatum ATCC 18648]